MKTVSVDGLTIEHRGNPPFVARSASNKTNDWPFWFVCGTDRINWMHINEGRGTYAAKFCGPELAVKIAEALNADG